jgi:D-glycero-D-manno-heptose 1,7-bisphosphate phosphatase
MLLRAAAELNLDLRRSWFVGDILDDVEAGNRAGCRTVLVDLGTEQHPEAAVRFPDFVARNTRHALNIISACESPRSRTGRATDFTYQPASWGHNISEQLLAQHIHHPRGASHEYAG